MAVYTEVRFEQADAFVRALGVGGLRSLRPILAGIENTNYFASTRRGEWVLTLFERLGRDELPFYLRLMKHLAGRGIPAPEPVADANGELLHSLAGKPAALLNRLPGAAALAPERHHVTQLGRMLARLHLAAADFTPAQAHPRGLAWWVETVPAVLPFLGDEAATLMRDELRHQQEVAGSAAARALPRGVIHADLFRDNVVFDGDGDDARLSGIFDFFFAGEDCLLFDLAVCLNDWCIEPDSGRLDAARAAVLVSAYEQLRPLGDGERRAMPQLLRAAAFRFWLSRLWDLHLPRDASLLRAHDPGHFERVLRQRVAHPWSPLH